VARRSEGSTKSSASKRAGMTGEQIVLAAVRICDEGGIESLTTRRLASDLGIGTMTLYGYFRSKEEILDAVADYVLGRFEVPSIDDPTPSAVAHDVAHAFLRMMREHPSVVYLLSSRATISHQSLKAAMEDVVSVLRDAGFRDETAAQAYALLITYCLGFATALAALGARRLGERGRAAQAAGSLLLVVAAARVHEPGRAERGRHDDAVGRAVRFRAGLPDRRPGREDQAAVDGGS
jgi:AcrR family transcriptional regulator